MIPAARPKVTPELAGTFISPMVVITRAWLPVSWLGFLRYPPLGTELVLYVEDLEATRRVLEEAGHDPGEIALQSWGDRDFRLTDPDGYYVRVSEGGAEPSSDR